MFFDKTETAFEKFKFPFRRNVVSAESKDLPWYKSKVWNDQLIRQRWNLQLIHIQDFFSNVYPTFAKRKFFRNFLIEIFAREFKRGLAGVRRAREQFSCWKRCCKCWKNLHVIGSTNKVLSRGWCIYYSIHLSIWLSLRLFIVRMSGVWIQRGTFIELNRSTRSARMRATPFRIQFACFSLSLSRPQFCF